MVWGSDWPHRGEEAHARRRSSVRSARRRGRRTRRLAEQDPRRQSCGPLRFPEIGLTRREEGRRLLPPPARLGDPRSGTDPRPATARHRSDGHRCHGARHRGVHQPAEEEFDVGPACPSGARPAGREYPYRLHERQRSGGARQDAARLDAGRHGVRQRAVAAVHALAYPIGAIFHVPHGLSNALVLMGVLRFNFRRPKHCTPNSPHSRSGDATAVDLRSGHSASWMRSRPSAGIAGSGLAGRGRRAGSRSAAPRRGRDEADAASGEQSTRGHLPGRLRDLQRSLRRHGRRPLFRRDVSEIGDMNGPRGRAQAIWAPRRAETLNRRWPGRRRPQGRVPSAMIVRRLRRPTS